MMWGWVGKRAAELAAHIIAEKAINAVLREQLARERERFDWLAGTVNEMKMERAALYQRIGIIVPVPQIERTSVPPLPGVDDNYAVPAGAQAGDVGELLAAARELRDKAARPTLSNVAAAVDPLNGFTGFEDIGDEAAEAAGIKRDATGSLNYSR